MDGERPDPLAEPEGYGRKPGGPAEREAPGTCNVAVSQTGLGREMRPCGLPAAEAWWWGCDRGEHAGPVTYCAAHLIPARLAKANAYCAVILADGSECRGKMTILKITVPGNGSSRSYSEFGRATFGPVTWPDGAPPLGWRDG